MFALRQRESSKPRPRSASLAPTSCRRSAAELRLSTSARRARSFFLRSRRAQTKSTFHWHGSLISGESIAEPPSPRGQIYWQRNGPVRLSSEHSSATLPQLISSFVSSTWNLKSHDELWLRAATRCGSHKRWQAVGLPPCSMSGKRSSWCSPQPKPFPIWNDELSSRKTSSAH